MRFVDAVGLAAVLFAASTPVKERFYIGLIGLCLSQEPPHNPTFWGLDAETWTAVGTMSATILALVLALAAAFAKSVNAWIHKPRLRPLLNQLPDHSQLVSIDNEGWWQLRLPIENSGWRGAATKVEVFLSAVRKENGNDPSDSPTYLPIRLHWTHAAGPICERIPAGINRLLDFGKVSPSTCILKFDTEIPVVNEDLVLASGNYLLQIIVAAENVTKRYSLRARIEDQPKSQKLTDLFTLELSQNWKD